MAKVTEYEKFGKWTISWIEPVPDAGNPPQTMVGTWRGWPDEPKQRGDYYSVHVVCPVGDSEEVRNLKKHLGKLSLMEALQKRVDTENKE